MEFVNYKYFNDLELKQRSYSFTFMLYPDSKEYDTMIALTSAVSANKWAYILHDKDEAKPHYHLAIKFDNQRRLKDVLDLLGLWNYNPNEQNPIVHSWKGILNYLIHNTKDSKDKYQYPEEEVESNIPNVIYNLRNSKDNEDIFLEIVDYITGFQENKYGDNPRYATIKYKNVIDFCRKQDDKYIKVFLNRSNAFILSELIKENR